MTSISFPSSSISSSLHHEAKLDKHLNFTIWIDNRLWFAFKTSKILFSPNNSEDTARNSSLNPFQLLVTFAKQPAIQKILNSLQGSPILSQRLKNRCQNCPATSQCKNIWALFQLPFYWRNIYCMQKHATLNDTTAPRLSYTVKENVFRYLKQMNKTILFSIFQSIHVQFLQQCCQCPNRTNASWNSAANYFHG